MLLTFLGDAVCLTSEGELVINDGTEALVFFQSLDYLPIYLKSRGAGGGAPGIDDPPIGFRDVQGGMVIPAPEREVVHHRLQLLR